jgi:hypothetical protein
VHRLEDIGVCTLFLKLQNVTDISRRVWRVTLHHGSYAVSKLLNIGIICCEHEKLFCNS